MRSGTSFFNKELYRKTVNRFWPLWAINLVIWLFVLPLNGLTNLRVEPERFLRYFSRDVGETVEGFGLWFALFMGLFVAMAVCSHMYNNRSANFMGALPVRREGQFISTYLAGLTILVGPNLLVAVLTLLVEVAGGAVEWVPLLYWLLAMFVVEFFFYSFAVCLGQFTGHILALPVYYAIFNAIVIVAYWLLDWVLGEFYFGFVVLSVGLDIAQLFTPVAALNSVSFNWDLFSEVPLKYVYSLEGEFYLVFYAVAALVLAGCALLLYRRRHLETAGDAVAVRAMRPVFKYGVAACSGMCLGYVTSQMLGLSSLGLMIAIVVWGLIGYFAAQMILDKTVRVFKKWKGAAAVTLAFLLLFAAVGFDLFGYETRVPDAQDVESVQLYGLGGVYNDSGSRLSGEIFFAPEIIEDAIALHRAITEFGPDGEDDGDPDTTTYLEFRVDYNLKSGGVIRRYYSVPAGERLKELGQTIWEHYEVRWKTYSLDYLQDIIELGARLESVGLWNTMDYSYYEDMDSAPILWEAVMADFAAGRIGIHDVGSNWYEEDCGEPMQLEFKWYYKSEWGYQGYSITFNVPEEAEDTWSVLKSLWADGILGDPGMLEQKK